MKKLDVGTIEIVESAKENALTVSDMINDLNEECDNYKKFEDGMLFEDLLKSEIQVQLNDANGKTIVGNIKLTVGYCVESLVLSGEVTDFYE